MRLTLRTMLAYLDDVLSESDAHDLEQKIESSDFATGLVHRIRNSIGRLRLSCPELLGSDSMDDPNTVSEFIDSALSPEREQEFEKVCLQSDKHLAEVASSHQVLTMVLGTPARVSPGLRERVCRQSVASAATQTPAFAPASRPEPFSDADLTDAALASEDHGPIAIKRPRTVVDSRAALAEFGQRRNIWPVAAAVLLGFLLTAGFLVAMGPLDGRHPLAGLLGLKEVPIAQNDGEMADPLTPEIVPANVPVPEVPVPEVPVPEVPVPEISVPDDTATAVTSEAVAPQHFQPTTLGETGQLPSGPFAGGVPRSDSVESNLDRTGADLMAIDDIELQVDQAVGTAPAASEFEPAVVESEAAAKSDGGADPAWVLPDSEIGTKPDNVALSDGPADAERKGFAPADRSVPNVDIPNVDMADNASDSGQTPPLFDARIVDPLADNSQDDLGAGGSIAFDTSPPGPDSNDPPLPGLALPGSGMMDRATLPSGLRNAFPGPEAADGDSGDNRTEASVENEIRDDMRVASLPERTGPAGAFPETALESQQPQVQPDTPAEVGRFLSEDQILLYWDDASLSWLRLPPRTAFGTGHRLRMLQNHRTQLLLSPSNIQLNSRGNTEATVAETEDGRTPTLDVRFGRFLLSAAGQSHSTVRLRTRGRTITIEFTEPNSEAACEVQPVLLPGLDPSLEPAHRFVQVWVTQGSAKIIESDQDGEVGEQQIDAGQIYAFADDADARVLAFNTVPSWLTQRIDPIDRDAAVELEPLLPLQRNAVLSLSEAADSRRTDVRSWALRHLVSLGEYRRAASLFSVADRKHQHTWPALFDEFRAVIARDAESAEAVRKTLLDLYGADSARLYRMLLGFDNEQLKAGEADQLVDELASPRVEFRVLAILNLKRITGKTLTYTPVLSEKFRATKVVRWRKELKRGKVLLTSTPKGRPTTPDQRDLAQWDSLMMTSLVP